MSSKPCKINEILNDDILAQIFMVNTEVDFNTPHIPSRTLRHTSQVSKKWRNLILALPSLWGSSLNFADSTRWFQTALDRAGDAPLNITYPPLSNDLLCDEEILSEWRHLEYDHILSLVHETSRGSIHIDKLDLALSFFPRSRRFRLRLCDEDGYMYVIRKAISLTAPHLEELAVSVMSYARNPNPPQVSTILAVGIPPRTNLRLLQLTGRGFTLRPPTIEFRTLRTLIVERMDENYMSTKEWLAILACAPQLEVLHLDSCFKRDDQIATSATGTLISLPKLRSIILDGLPVDICTILLRIRFPQSCAMNIRLVEDSNDTRLALIKRLFVFLQERMQDIVARQKIVDLSLFLKRYPGLGWKLWNNIHSGDERTLSVSWLPREEKLDRLPVFPCLNLLLEVISPDLTSLYLDTAKITQQEPPYRTSLPLQGMENVKTLSIPSTGTLKYIWQLFTDDHTAKRAHPLLPALQLIILGSVYITKKAKDRFYSIFEMRTQIGAPIPKCRVQECNGRYLKVLIGDLRALGIHVEWDGKYRTSDIDLAKPDVTRTLEHLAIQTEWNGDLKEDMDDLYDSDDFAGSDLDGEDEDGGDDEDGDDD